MVDSNRRFTSEEVSAIVRRGLEHQSGAGDVSYEKNSKILPCSPISLLTCCSKPSQTKKPIGNVSWQRQNGVSGANEVFITTC